MLVSHKSLFHLLFTSAPINVKPEAGERGTGGEGGGGGRGS